MLKHLFHRLARPSLDDPDPGRRRRAVLRLDPTLEPQRLMTLAREDTDTNVRAACIARLQTAPELLALCDEPDLHAAAQGRLRQLIETGQIDPLQIADRLRQARGQRHLLFALQRPEHWQPMLAGIDSERTLSEIAIEHGSPAVRLAAANRVRSEGALRRVERGCRSRDKAVARLMRDRLEHLRQLRQQLQTLDERSDRLLAELTQLSHHPEDPQAGSRLEWLQEQFTAMVDERATLEPELSGFGLELPPAPDSTPHFARQQNALRTTLAQLQRQRDEAAAAQAAEAAQRDEQVAVVASMEALWAQMAERLQDHPAPASELTALRAALSLEQQRWAAVSEQPEPDAALAVRQQQVAAQLGQLVDALSRLDALPELPEKPEQLADLTTTRTLLEQAGTALEALDWPASIPIPAQVRILEQRQPALRQHLRQLQAAGAEQTRAARAALGRLEAALADGRLRSAQKQLDRVRRTVERSDDSQLKTRLQRARERIDEMRDWNQFATADKRQQLVDAMQALTTEPLATPQEQAERVRNLRERWQALGPASPDEQPQQAAFDAAAETAFAPCRQYFARRSEEQKANAEAQRRICTELETFLRDYDWTTADWPAVVRIYQHAREEWRRYRDVVPEHNQAPRFHALMRSLRAQLAPQWKASIARKRELIEAAQALSHQQAGERRIQALEQAWQKVGITPAGEDRKLRRAFQDACNATRAALPRATTDQHRKPEQETPLGALQLALLEARQDDNRSDR